jgi:lysophospholipase L1-like esterase
MIRLPRDTPMRGRKILSDLLTIIVITLIVFVILEVSIRATYFARNSMVHYVPLPYVIGDDYGPMPPWLDELRLLVPDEVLLWKFRPNLRRTYLDVFTPAHSEHERRSILRQFIPSIPVSLQHNHAWDIALNSRGFRDQEFPIYKQPKAYRIICLGDSWTFGANVGQDMTYPSQIGELLRRNYPGKHFEVLNLGVLGYSSFQGLQLMQNVLAELKPDLVIIGFAMNDASIAGYRDKDIAASFDAPKPWGKILGEAAERLELYKLGRYILGRLSERPNSLGEHLKSLQEKDLGDWWTATGRKVMDQDGYERMEPWTRVSPKDYRQNILDMITIARRHQADVVLLNNALWRGGAYAMALESISNAENVPLIDSSALIEKARDEMEAQIEKQLGLTDRPPRPEPSDDQVEVIFRVYADTYPVPKSININGVFPQLGGLIPNRVTMHDDGTHGDQRAGDRVWSYGATFPQGTIAYYVYTNSGDEGKWEGLDVPHVRDLRIDPGEDQKVEYRPIESFGTIYMQADGWHTNAKGYGLIAKAVLEVLKKNERLKDFLAR